MVHVLTEGTFQREDEEANHDFTRPENCLQDEAVRTVLGRGHPELMEISWSPHSSRARPWEHILPSATESITHVTAEARFMAPATGQCYSICMKSKFSSFPVVKGH